MPDAPDPTAVTRQIRNGSATSGDHVMTVIIDGETVVVDFELVSDADDLEVMKATSFMVSEVLDMLADGRVPLFGLTVMAFLAARQNGNRRARYSDFAGRYTITTPAEVVESDPKEPAG